MPLFARKRQALPTGKGRAEARNKETTSSRDSDGLIDSINAIAPATWGAAMLVPYLIE
jgi:hypothetical protein